MPAPTQLEREMLARLDALEAKVKPKTGPAAKDEKTEAKAGPRGGIGV